MRISEMQIIEAKTAIIHRIGHQLRKRHGQRIDIRALIGLSAAILLWRGKARRAQQLRILRAGPAEQARNTKIDQLNTSIARQHNIAWLEVAENHWRLLAVQIFQHVAALARPAQHAAFRERSMIIFEQLFLSSAGDILHDPKIACAIREKVSDRWQSWMCY